MDAYCIRGIITFLKSTSLWIGNMIGFSPMPLDWETRTYPNPYAALSVRTVILSWPCVPVL
jgi:hypothetical protein